MKIKCQEYEWCFDESTGKLTCSKNGLKWRDETGDHAVLALLEVACELKEQPVTVKTSGYAKVDASAVVEKYTDLDKKESKLDKYLIGRLDTEVYDALTEIRDRLVALEAKNGL